MALEEISVSSAITYVVLLKLRHWRRLVYPVRLRMWSFPSYGIGGDQCTQCDYVCGPFPATAFEEISVPSAIMYVVLPQLRHWRRLVYPVRLRMWPFRSYGIGGD